MPELLVGTDVDEGVPEGVAGSQHMHADLQPPGSVQV